MDNNVRITKCGTLQGKCQYTLDLSFGNLTTNNVLKNRKGGGRVSALSNMKANAGPVYRVLLIVLAERTN